VQAVTNEQTGGKLMRKGKQKRKPIIRRLAALMCASLVVQNLPINIFAAEAAVEQTIEIQSEEIQTEKQEEEIQPEQQQTEEAQTKGELEDGTEQRSEETESQTDSEKFGEQERLEGTTEQIQESDSEEETAADSENNTESTMEDESHFYSENEATTVEEETTEKETLEETTEEENAEEVHEKALRELEHDISQIDSEMIQVNAIDTSGFMEKYGLTYQDLLFRCPEYLDNQRIELYLDKRFRYGVEVWGEALVNEDTAKLMHNLKKGLSYNVKSLLGEVGILNTEYENFQIDMAKAVVKDYLKADASVSAYYKEMAEAFSKIDKVYDVMDKVQLDEFAEKMQKVCKHLSKRDIENIIETIKNAKPFLENAGDASTAFKLCASIISMQEIDIGAVELLIEAQEPFKENNELYTGLCLLKNQLEYDPAAYVLANYCVDEVIDALVDQLAEYSAAALFGGGGATVLAVVKILGKTVAWVYEWKNPSYTDIKYATICHAYYDEATSVERKYRQKFKNQKVAAARDEIRYEAVCQTRYSCLRVFLLNAKSCTRNKTIERKLQTYYDSVADMDLYGTYIALCMTNASNALKNGTLELKDVVIRKTDKGEIIDENYDPTESIKAKYSEIQKKYPPDVSRKWKESYGGAIQCFGFARMVFNLLFGCDMPSAYKGGKRYEYINNINVTVVGQLEGNNVTAENMKTLVSQGKLGDVSQGYGEPYGQHTMILQEIKDTGAVFYQCNYMNDDCLIYTQFYTWEALANRYGRGDGTSGNGFTLYRANNYGMIYGDGSDLFYDDSVNFVISDGVLVKYNGWQSHVVIPDTVTAIGDDAFKNNKTMMTVDIPDSVTIIGNQAFYGCTGLIGVMIPDSVVTIGYSAFSDCSNLASVQLSNHVTSIGYYAFRNCNMLKGIEIPKSLENTTPKLNISSYSTDSGIFYGCDGLRRIVFEEGTTKIVNCLFANCNGIEEIQIPDTITVIEEYAFYNCANLKDVVISNSVTEIQERAFENCKNLIHLIISNRIISIGYWAFRDCDKLEDVEIPKSLNRTTPEKGIPGALNSGIFYGCDCLKTIKFEDGTTKIANYIFANCSGLEEIEIPDTATVIEEYAFYNCANLRNVGISNSVTLIKERAFEKCSSLINLKMSQRVLSIGYWAFRDCDKLEKVEIPKSLNKTTLYVGLHPIDSGIFYECDSLKTVIFEEGTAKIVNCLFANCTGLEEIKIPDTVKNIENHAFYNCRNLRKVSISESVEKVGEYAFAKDCELLEISLSDKVAIIGDYTFSGCTSLTTVKLPSTIPAIEQGMFQNCTSLTAIELPETVTAIRQYAFQNAGLTALTLPKNVTTIENYAFDGCTDLAQITFNESLKTIGMYAFRNNDAMTELTVPDSVTTIGENAYQDCDALTTAVISDSVTSIGAYIFAHCDSLKDVKLGTGISKIPAYAFNLCPELQKIVLPYRVSTIDANAFTNCTKLTEIMIPRGTASISASAFSYPDRLTIYGISGTYAETYANQIGAAFVDREVHAEKITLNHTALSMLKGAKQALVMRVEPEDFTDEVVWAGNNPDILEVDSTGMITAKAVGTATVRVAVGAQTASCTVTVAQPVTGISLSKSSLSLDAFEEYTLTASVYPSNADDKSVEWMSSDETIAVVSQNGKVTPLSKGVAVITVKAKDGSNRTAQCNVTVISEGTNCTQYSQLESVHNYDNNTNKIWKYIYSGAKTLDITFDNRTNVDEGFDYLYIYDKDNREIKKSTGTELAGKSVQINGDTVKIKLVSDGAVTAWGFKVSKISADGKIIGADEEKPEEPETPEQPEETEPSTEEPSTEETLTEPEEEPSTQEPATEPEESVKDGFSITGLRTKTYTGNAVKQEIKVYYNKHLLREGTDYTLSYKSNKNAGQALITVKAKGNLTGTVTKTFQIQPRQIKDPNVIIEDAVYSYDKKTHKKAPAITYNGKKLKQGKDFEIVDYGSGDYRAIGTYTMKIKGIGNYAGNFDNAKVIIVDKDKNLSKAKVSKIPVQSYQNGLPIVLPDHVIQVKLNRTILQKDVDYTVSYANNVDVGKATLIIRGKEGRYAGTKTVKFTIKRTPAALSDSMVANKSSIDAVRIQKKGAMPKPELVSDGYTLVEHKDYTLSYKNNKKTGTGLLKIKGKGNYKGQLSIPFHILDKELANKELTIRIPDVPYTGKAGRYQSNPVLTDSDGGVLIKNKDYVIEAYHAGNTLLDNRSHPEEGTVITVTILGKGSYTGTIQGTYTVKGIDFSQAVIKVGTKPYTGNPVTINSSDITKAVIKTGKAQTPLKLGTDYEIAAYSNNLKKGTASVTFKGIGNYAGEKTVKFKIQSARIE